MLCVIFHVLHVYVDQDCSKTAQDSIQMGEDGAKTTTLGPKTAPEPSKMVPEAPRCSQERSRGAPGIRKPLKYHRCFNGSAFHL